MEMLHVTPSRNVPDILREGLVPQIGNNSAAAGEKAPSIYLFRDWDAVETALLNWLGEAHEGVPLSILRVSVSKAFLSHEEGSFEYICQTVIPPENIREILAE